MITIALAEDHQSIIDGIELLLKYEENFHIVGTANNGHDLWEIIKKKQPQVVITDIKMPKMDGVVLTKLIKENYPQIKIIGFSMFDQAEAIQELLDAGASGYLLKNSPLTQILEAIDSVLQGTTFIDSQISLPKTTSSRYSKDNLLTKSEIEIVRLIGEGKTSSEIAEQRFTAVSTVEKHRKNIIFKLGLSGKGELLRYALEKKYDY